MTTDVGIVVGIVPETSGAREIKRSLDDINAGARSAANENKRLEQQIKSTTSAAYGLGNAFKAMFAAYGAREVLRIADQYTVMQARINGITKSAQETTRVMGELRKISGDTGSEMETSLSILQRLSFVREEIKATNNDMLAFTETVTKLGVTSGALPEAMKAGLTQLGQALSSQYTRAEEFNSIMENIPAVGKAIADQLGVTTGQMRLLVVEGKLLSSDVFAAILNQTEKVRAEFEEFPKTASQGLKQLGNSFDQIIAQANSATGATNGIGIALRGIGEGAKIVYNGLGTVFDYLVAGIQEGVNLIDIAINKVKQSINDVSKFIPGYGGTNFSLTPTLEVGGVFAAANAARKEREKALFTDDLGAVITPEQRKISQDYAKIAAGLNADKDAQRAAKKAERDAARAAAKAQREALAEEKRQQNELESAINGSRTEFEKLNDEIAHLEKLKGVAKTAEQVDLLNRGIRNTQAELDKLRLKTELDSPLAKGFAAVAGEIQDGFKDAFKGAFDGGGSLFKKMADGMKATFKSLLLDMAYQAAVRPIVVSVLGVAGGSLGLSGSAIASILGKTGGSASGAGGLSLLGSGSSLLSAGKAFLAGKSLTAGLGARSLPLSTGLGFGAETSGNIANFISNAGTFGNLAGGFAGGLGANLLGLGSKNGYVNAGLGTIGGLAGSVFGPVGSFAGSFLGTALGGLFGGGKPSDKAQWGGIDLASLANYGTGGLSGKKYSDENAKFRDGVLGNAGQLAQLLKSAGGTTSGSLFVTVGNRDGLRLGTGKSEQNFGTNSQAFINAVMQQVVNSTSGLNATMQQILSRTGTGDLNQLASNLDFGKRYDAIGQKAVDPLTQAMSELNSQFENMRQTANNLGFPLEKINTEYFKQKEALEQSIKAQQAGFSSFTDLTKAFDGFFNSQALGSNSSLNPLQKLGVAQSNFGDLLSKAQGGDLSVTQDLLSSANTLLSLGRDTYASGADFTGLESFVKSSVSGVAKQSGYTGQSVAANIVSTNQAVLAKITELVELTKTTKADTFRLANKAAVGA